jgi:hypothetical protein
VEMDPSAEPCIVCALPASTPCTSCNAANYCSKVCLNRDEPVHRLLCLAMASLPPKPEPNRILGVLLPSDREAPLLTWVELKKFTDEYTSISFHEVNTEPFFPDDAIVDSQHSEYNRVQNRNTQSMLELWHIGSPNLEPNRCIEALAGGTPCHKWTGPVLGLAMTRSTGYMVDPGTYQDLTLGDFRDIVDFVVDYGNQDHAKRTQEILETLGSKVINVEHKKDPEDDRSTGGYSSADQASYELV